MRFLLYIPTNMHNTKVCFWCLHNATIGYVSILFICCLFVYFKSEDVYYEG